MVVEPRLFNDNNVQRSIIPLLATPQVQATDMDGSSRFSRIFYRISPQNSKFVINSQTGEIVVAPGAILDPDLMDSKIFVSNFSRIEADANAIENDGKVFRMTVLGNFRIINFKLYIF